MYGNVLVVLGHGWIGGGPRTWLDWRWLVGVGGTSEMVDEVYICMCRRIYPYTYLFTSTFRFMSVRQGERRNFM